jgi:uncharacterized protein YndB with AHSA1/START domain
MYDTLLEVTIAATPDKVFKAITEQQGVEGWWASQVVTEPKVGSTLQATFHSGSDHEFVIKMEVVNLEPAGKIEWIPRQGAPEWSGTHITWDLAPVEQGTKVLFGQRGFATDAADGNLPGRDGWAFYLTSLKDYLETGKGNPGGLRTRLSVR